MTAERAARLTSDKENLETPQEHSKEKQEQKGIFVSFPAGPGEKDSQKQTEGNALMSDWQFVSRVSVHIDLTRQ